MPPDTGPPPHRHHAEDQTFILLEGALTFRMGEDDDRRPAGHHPVRAPRDRPQLPHRRHAPARMLFMYSPAGMEGMFAEIGAPGVRGVQGPPLSPEDVAAMIAVSAKYNFSIAD